MIRNLLSPINQLKLKNLQTQIEQKTSMLYFITIDSQRLYEAFIHFLYRATTPQDFVIYRLYEVENVEEEINKFQLNRDALIADNKRHIFLMDNKALELFIEKGDFLGKVGFNEKFNDNGSVSEINSQLFESQEMYQLVEEYEKNKNNLNSNEKRALVREIAFNAHRLMQHKLSLKYFLLLSEMIKELEDTILEAMCYSFIGGNYRNLNQNELALKYYYKALKLSEQEHDEEEIATIYDELGSLYLELLEYERSENYYLRAIAINKRLNFFDDLAQNYTHLGILYSEQKRYKEALSCYQKSKTIHQQQHNYVGVADNLNNIGLAYYLNGYFIDSLSYFNQALELYHKQENIVEVASVVGNIGMVYYDMADWDKALENHYTALDIYKKFEIDENIAKSYGNIGLVYYKQRKYQESIKFFQKGLAIHQKLNDKPNIYHDYNNLALAYMAEGNHSKAIVYLEEILAYTTQIEDSDSIAKTSINLGSIYLKEKQVDKALSFFKKAITQKDITELTISRCHHNFAQCYLLKGELAEALKHVDSALKLNRELENIESMAFEYKIKAQIQIKLNKYEQALKNLIKSVDIVETIKDKKELFELYYEIGTTYQRLNQFSNSIEYFQKALNRAKEDKDQVAQADSLLSLGISFLYSNNKQKAIINLNEAYLLAQEIGYDRIIEVIEEEFM